jgi:hypothetical protein
VSAPLQAFVFSSYLLKVLLQLANKNGIQKKKWENVYLDIVGPLPPTENGRRYILTCQGNLSKYFIAAPIPNQSAEEVTNAFVRNIILVNGIPTEIVTNQGSNFMSDMYKRICRLFKIEKICTTACHP